MDYLERLHKTEVEILDEIVRICEKHNLKYYLIGGTLLGAIRHKGFIPWDDDLDIVMPRADYDRFREICKTELEDNYYLHDINSDRHYWLIFAKIRKKNTIFDESSVSTIDVPKGIYVDVFPLDNAPCEKSKKQLRLTKMIKNISSIIYAKRKLNVKFKLKSKLAAIFVPFSIKALTKYQLKLMTKHNKDNTCEYYINYGSNYNTVKQTIHKSKFEPSSKVEFEGKLYNTLGDPHYFLNRLYGEDYMELPPVEKRVTHKPVRVEFDVSGQEK